MILADDMCLPILNRLPPVRGRLNVNEPLGRFTWFKVGGVADALFYPSDVADLASFLSACPIDIPVMVMGNASNMLVRDGGVRGVVIRLGREFQDLSIDAEVISAGGSVAGLSIARAARDAALGGLEFLAGIPGTIGGAVVMNSGAYGREIKNVLISCSIVSRSGAVSEVPFSAIKFGYRQTSLSDGEIITAVKLQANPGDPIDIRARMDGIQAAREVSQPVRKPTGGSTFKNLPNASAWELIEAAGCRGLKLGGAAVSDKHCNFLINSEGATATDLEMLGEEVRRRVLAHAGIQLEWEIRRVGQPAVGTAGEDSL